jgi:hypothetical protein
MRMLPIEVNVEGTELFEQLILMRIKDVRTVIGSLSNIDRHGVRVAFHPCVRTLRGISFGGVLELHIDGDKTRTIPYADQLRDHLARQIGRLAEAEFLVSVPQQSALYQTSHWRPQSQLLRR